MAKMYGKGKTAVESEEQQRIRWQVELEFVQCLANPNYLNFLAQRGYFKDQAFINYLKYLQYWKEPEYAKYLMYPMCLYFLDMLQYEHFRREIVNSQCCKFIDDQAILQWQHYTRKRMKLFNSVVGVDGPGAGADGQQQPMGTAGPDGAAAATACGEQQQGPSGCAAGAMGGMQNGGINVGGGQQQNGSSAGGGSGGGGATVGTHMQK